MAEIVKKDRLDRDGLNMSTSFSMLSKSQTNCCRTANSGVVSEKLIHLHQQRQIGFQPPGKQLFGHVIFMDACSQGFGPAAETSGTGLYGLIPQ